MDYCPDYLLASGSFDGRIIVWNSRYAIIHFAGSVSICVLVSAISNMISLSALAFSLLAPRGSYAPHSSGRVATRFDTRTCIRSDAPEAPRGHPVRPAVDKLLWLQERVHDIHNNKVAIWVVVMWSYAVQECTRTSF